MKQLISFLVFILILFSSLLLYSQGEIPIDDEIFYKDERSLGLKINTNGWGLNYRRGYFVNPSNKNLWEIDFNIIKHQKEYKISNPYSFTTKRFVYGKMNSCLDFRFGFGRQKRLYRKVDKGSVEIRLISFIGPTLGFLKPVYYEICDTFQCQKPKSEKFKPSHQPALINGRSSFFKGISETKINPGIYFKLGISFEHGKYEEQLRALEIGFTTYVYLREMEIMAEIPNSQLFFTLFFSYRIGKVFHGGHHSKRNKKDKMDIGN